MPDPDALSLAKDIAQALHVIYEGEETPVSIIIDPSTRDVLERACLGSWRTGRHVLFSLPVEIDASVDGWKVRVNVPAFEPQGSRCCGVRKRRRTGIGTRAHQQAPLT